MPSALGWHWLRRRAKTGWLHLASRHMHSRGPTVVAAACILVLPYLLWQYSSLESNSTLLGCPQVVFTNDVATTPQTRFRVAVASHFGFHFDVYMALVGTLERVMARREGGGTVEVYADQPFGFDFQQIVDELGLYRGTVKPPDSLVREINANTGPGGIDMVILGTCEVDLRGDQQQELLAAWDSRPAAHKFKIVCIVHNIEDDDWQLSIREWSRRDAIRLLPISEHVAAAFKQSFLISADSADPSIRLAGFENIPVDVHVPVLDIPVSSSRKPSRALSAGVIQGSFFSDRRDYLKIFSELNESLTVDPKLWGYLPLRENNVAYVVDTSLPDPPFRLFLIGSGYIEIPPELENLVVVRNGLNYPDFYNLMRQMDIALTAFSEENGYYHSQASSTFAMAVECNVPILVTERIKKSYTYVDDPRAVVTRPAAMREVEALRALRSGDVSYFLHQTSIEPDSSTAHSAQSMLHKGWVHSADESRSFKEKIWIANERVVERILRDL